VDASWCGQIVGPHGTGKTTLLAAIEPELRRMGRTTITVTPGRGSWRATLASAWRRTCVPTQLIVDGYEQLGLLARWRLHRWCRQAGHGLLVTTHRPARLPIIYRTLSSLDTAHELVRQLTENTAIVIDPQFVERAFRAHDGNLREVFFDLYDVAQRSGAWAGADGDSAARASSLT
jgi:hypothetical protein